MLNKVEGKEDLYKDPSTNTVLNTNRNDYERYKQSIRNNKKLISRVEELEATVRRLETAIENLSSEQRKASK